MYSGIAHHATKDSREIQLYYINNFAYNMRINNTTRKILNVRRNEYARLLEPKHKHYKSMQQTAADAEQAYKEDAFQIVARLRAMRERHIHGESIQFQRFRQKLTRMYQGRELPTATRVQPKTASAKCWKEHTHYWAETTLAKRREEKRARDAEPVVSHMEWLKITGNRAPTSLARLRTILDLTIDNTRRLVRLAWFQQ